jgi:signal transduction histidine kinase
LHRDGREIVFRAEDSGPGIPEAERELVFERFYRRPEAGSEGSGLGLAIVREIVLAHDGAIDLRERSPPPGLVATVRLPAAGTSPSEAEPKKLALVKPE